VTPPLALACHVCRACPARSCPPMQAQEGREMRPCPLLLQQVQPPPPRKPTPTPTRRAEVKGPLRSVTVGVGDWVRVVTTVLGGLGRRRKRKRRRRSMGGITAIEIETGNTAAGGVASTARTAGVWRMASRTIDILLLLITSITPIPPAGRMTTTVTKAGAGVRMGVGIGVRMMSGIGEARGIHPQGEGGEEVRVMM